jgi:hypothetical protein
MKRGKVERNVISQVVKKVIKEDLIGDNQSKGIV